MNLVKTYQCQVEPIDVMDVEPSNLTDGSAYIVVRNDMDQVNPARSDISLDKASVKRLIKQLKQIRKGSKR